MGAGESPVQRASIEFVAELTRWRTERGLSKKQLAAAMGFDPSYVSHVEARRHRPTEDFARRAETILQTGGTLWERFRRYDELRIGARLAARMTGTGESWLPPGTGLVVDNEVATLSYHEDGYRCTVRRSLYNAGTDPVTRYPMRIAIDRYPEDPERSNRHHRKYPLTWDELELTAFCDGEPMIWRSKTDRDASKEAWLLFENAHSRFPLYPGQRATISYSYRVGTDKWGPYFQRAVRLPTRKLSIELDFPVNLRPSVWGVETSLSAESVPLRTPITLGYTGEGRVVYSWHTESPTLHAWYRLEWRFRGGMSDPVEEANEAAIVSSPAMVVGGPAEAWGTARTESVKVESVRGDGVRWGGLPRQGTSADPAPWSHDARGRASERMRAAGIVQRGERLLRTQARRFDLPREASVAVDVITKLSEALERVDALHPFVKGVGLAAPQIGLNWAAAVVRPAGGENTVITLLNPQIMTESPEQDERYEGCLSFFDVRGLVSRPLRITVERALPTGDRVVEAYERAVARLVAHEIDHLYGRLYVDRLGAEKRLLSVEEYRETGRPWY